jgi:TonB family protein
MHAIMRVLLPVLLASLSVADDGSAAALVEMVSKVASETKTWRIDGSVSNSIGGDAETVPFTLVARTPNQLNFRQLNGRTPATIVCDGAKTLVYSPPLRMYSQATPADSPDCSLILESWKKLSVDLKGPTLGGRCGADPSAESTEYEIIRGTSLPDQPIKGEIQRTLCVDPGRNVILWERAELGVSRRLYLYARVERNVDLPPDSFRLDPPPGTELSDVDLPMPRALGSRGPLNRPGFEPPRAVRTKPPNYDERARMARIEGTTVLWAIISVEGVAIQIKVYRSLTPGLDAEAVKALKAWKFEPAKLNGVPRAEPVTIEMNFRLR